MDTAAAKKSTIDGRWQLLRAEMDGEVAPELLTMKTELEFKSGEYIVRFGGNITDRGTYELGTANNSTLLILRGSEGPNTGHVIPCLVQHVGNRLRVCYGLDGVLPTDYQATKGMNRYSAKYRPISE